MATQPASSNQKVLSVFTLAMINVVAIIGLKNLPTLAEYGVGLIFYALLVAVTFFIPTSLVSAELATGWPQTGGVYNWVKAGLGERYGFLAIWFQWVSNVVFLPSSLAFGAATLAYTIAPSLATNKIYTILLVLGTLWLFTILNFGGMKVSGMISSIGAVAGTIIPSAVIILLGIIWVCMGKPMAVSFGSHSFIPPIHSLAQLAMLTVLVLSMQGMEMSAAHAGDVKNPGRDYPKAIFLSTIIILIILIAASLSIAIVVPRDKISLVAGIMEALEMFFGAYHLKWLAPVFGIMVAFGVFAQVSSWIAGPPRGLSATGRNGDLPPLFQHLNKNDMPVNLLVFQGVIVTIFAFVFLLMPNISSAFLILSALTAQTYLLMYILMFITAIRLRYLRPEVARPYKVPGGNPGMWIVAGLGILSSLITFALGFFPPAQIKTGSVFTYEAILIVAIGIMCLPPFIIYHLRKPSWKEHAARLTGAQ
jgi:putative glutamate/gamma-aminobutyrate antiporter